MLNFLNTNKEDFMKTNTIYNIFRQKLLPVLLMMNTFTIANESFCGETEQKLICYRNLIELGANNPSLFNFASESDAESLAWHLSGVARTRREAQAINPSIPLESISGLTTNLIKTAWVDIEDYTINVVPHSAKDADDLNSVIPLTRQYLLDENLDNLVKWKLLIEQIHTFFVLQQIENNDKLSLEKNNVLVCFEDTNITDPVLKLLAYASQENTAYKYQAHLTISKASYSKLSKACELMEQAWQDTENHLCKYLDQLSHDQEDQEIVQTVKERIQEEFALRIAHDKTFIVFLEVFFKAIENSTDKSQILKNKLGTLNQKVRDDTTSSTGPITTYTSKTQK